MYVVLQTFFLNKHIQTRQLQYNGIFNVQGRKLLSSLWTWVIAKILTHNKIATCRAKGEVALPRF